MKWLGRNQPPVYHTVGWSLPNDALCTFTELRLPDATLRLIDKRVHKKAVDNAGRKLGDLLRCSGPRNRR
jgi:hypothetical protein